MSSDAEVTKPHVLVVLLAGLICPGAGLLAAGRLRTGLSFAAAFAGAALAVPLLVLALDLDLSKLPGLVRAASLALWAPSAVFGVVAAALAAPGPRRPWQHPWWLFGVILVTWTLRLGLSERVVGAHMVAFVTPTEAQLRAVAPTDADVRGVFVVARRQFEARHLVPGTWALVRDSQGIERAARVLAVDGMVQLDDGRTVERAAITGLGVLAR